MMVGVKVNSCNEGCHILMKTKNKIDQGLELWSIWKYSVSYSALSIV